MTRSSCTSTSIPTGPPREAVSTTRRSSGPHTVSDAIDALPAVNRFFVLEQRRRVIYTFRPQVAVPIGFKVVSVGRQNPDGSVPSDSAPDRLPTRVPHWRNPEQHIPRGLRRSRAQKRASTARPPTHRPCRMRRGNHHACAIAPRRGSRPPSSTEATCTPRTRRPSQHRCRSASAITSQPLTSKDPGSPRTPAHCPPRPTAWPRRRSATTALDVSAKPGAGDRVTTATRTRAPVSREEFVPDNLGDSFAQRRQLCVWRPAAPASRGRRRRVAGLHYRL